MHRFHNEIKLSTPTELKFYKEDFHSFQPNHIIQKMPIYKFNLVSPIELKLMNMKTRNRDGETIDLNTIKFYPFNQLDEMSEIYIAEKNLKNK